MLLGVSTCACLQNIGIEGVFRNFGIKCSHFFFQIYIVLLGFTESHVNSEWTGGMQSSPKSTVLNDVIFYSS